MKWLLSFRGAVLTLCLLAAIYIVASPLMTEFWAWLAWERVPCYLAAEKDRYFFTWNNKNYAASRVNVWGAVRNNPAIVEALPTTFSFNGKCYVQIKSGNSVGESVIRLDGYKDVGKIAGRAGVAIMVLCVAVLITRTSTRKPLAKIRSDRIGA